MDEILEELYMLLDLYFSVQIGSGIVRTKEHKLVEPALERLELRETVLKEIIRKSQKLHSL